MREISSTIFIVLLFIASSLTAKDNGNWVINLQGDTIKDKMYFDLRDQYDHDRVRVKSDTGSNS